MADYTNWLKRCVYRNYMEQELALYQGQGPGQTSFLFYGHPDTNEEMLADCFLQIGRASCRERVSA